MYLKLHGSLDWAYCANDACHNYRRGVSMFDAMLDDGTDYYSRRCGECGDYMPTAIVPPTFSKTYEKLPSLMVQWKLAVRELQRASRLVVVGLSFAPSDARLSWLMQYGMWGAGAADARVDYVCDVRGSTESEVAKARADVEQRVHGLFHAGRAKNIRICYKGLATFLSELS